ncbi:hypothetical protein FCV25MIE_07418 [Fagus crenata]
MHSTASPRRRPASLSHRLPPPAVQCLFRTAYPRGGTRARICSPNTSLAPPPPAVGLELRSARICSPSTHGGSTEDQGDLHAGSQLHHDRGQDRFLDQIRRRQRRRRHRLSAPP